MDSNASREASLRAREEALKEREREMREAEAGGFAPRRSLARSPPQTPRRPAVARAATMPETMEVVEGSAKRPLSATSPDASQEDRWRKVQSRRTSTAPPLGGIMGGGPIDLVDNTTSPAPAVVPEESSGSSGLSGMDKVQLLEQVQEAVRGIMGLTTACNKMNKTDQNAIGSFGQEILAVVGALELRLAAAESEILQTKLNCAKLELRMQTSVVESRSGVQQQQIPQTVSYANTLKLQSAKPTAPKTVNKGPVVAFYPNAEEIKTAEDTKKVLQTAIKPGQVQVPISGVRKIGNAGIIVQTSSVEAAERLKAAAPPSLRTVDPKRRQPLVAIINLRADPKVEDLMADLYNINLVDDPAWSMEQLKKECKVAFKKSRLGQPRTTVVLECSPRARNALVGLEYVYIGWDKAEVQDYIRVTLCRKCQQYGHPEKHCRAAQLTCAKCGENGHKNAECQSKTECCATCKRFKRKDASGHLTGARDCPARKYSEQQSITTTQYG